MKKYIFILLIFPAILAANSYKINSGDLLRIEVFGEPELALDVNVSDLGFIEYPFVGKLNVAGQPIDAIQTTLVSLLKDGYFVRPQVTVSVKEFQPFFIQGEINSPGSFPFEIGMTVRKALSLAGGLTERANKKKLYVTRVVNGKRESIKADLDFKIQTGDIIDIKESFF